MRDFRHPSKRLWIWGCVLLVALIAGWIEHGGTPRELSVEAYVWQRQDSPELREALSRSRPLVSRYHFLGAEIVRDSAGWRVSRSSVPDASLAGQGLVLRLGASLAGEKWEDGKAVDRVLGELSHLVAKPAVEWQIDYDCPQRSLENYRRLLEKIKARFPGKRWTITALPSWLHEPSVRGLFAAADGVVLQVHSLVLPEKPGQTVVLCDPAAARAAVKRMAGFGIPFRVALNTYGCEVLFDDKGSVVEVVSEDVGNPPPARATRRSVGISDAKALAELVAGWRRDPPRGMKGVVWYRLPLDSDQRNWRWVTWTRVATGAVPESKLRIEARAGANGAWDLLLSNVGECDEPLPEFISSGCETLVLEGLNGYRFDESERLHLIHAPWPWLPPGAALTVGWLRAADSSETPTPSILPSP